MTKTVVKRGTDAGTRIVVVWLLLFVSVTMTMPFRATDRFFNLYDIDDRMTSRLVESTSGADEPRWWPERAEENDDMSAAFGDEVIVTKRLRSKYRLCAGLRRSGRSDVEDIVIGVGWNVSNSRQRGYDVCVQKVMTCARACACAVCVRARVLCMRVRVRAPVRVCCVREYEYCVCACARVCACVCVSVRTFVRSCVRVLW